MKKITAILLLVILFTLPIQALAAYEWETDSFSQWTVQTMWKNKDWCAMGAWSLLLDMKSNIPDFLGKEHSDENLNCIYLTVIDTEEELISYIYFYGNEVWLAGADLGSGEVSTESTTTTATPLENMEYMMSEKIIEKYKEIPLVDYEKVDNEMNDLYKLLKDTGLL